MEFFEPRISADTQAFWDGCRAHELHFQCCKNCGRLRWPASYICPDCLSEDMEMVTLPPEGIIYAFVVMHRPFHPSLSDKVPYVVATVDLTKDIRIITNIFDCDPDEIHCGDEVVIDWEDSASYSRPIARIKGDKI